MVETHATLWSCSSGSGNGHRVVTTESPAQLRAEVGLWVLFSLPSCTSTLGRTLGHPKSTLCLRAASLGTKVPGICHGASQLELVDLWIGDLQAGGSWGCLGSSGGFRLPGHTGYRPRQLLAGLS